jgi:hypothetical protein
MLPADDDKNDHFAQSLLYIQDPLRMTAIVYSEYLATQATPPMTNMMQSRICLFSY